MPDLEHSLPPLSVRQNAAPTKMPFTDELPGRRKLAEKLTSYINRLQSGAVIAIDAPWGEGKTWFGQHWAEALRNDGHRVIFLDAFKQDYVEEPFLLIAAEIADALEDKEGEEIRKKAAVALKTLAPAAGKVIVNVLGRLVLGASNISDDIESALEAANDGASDAAQKLIEDRLHSYAEDKKSLEHFRDVLKTMAEAQQKPMVFFIDELDRCKPSFAVRLIERIKHFFDTPNIVFVLLMHREQLENSIQGVYGPSTNASIYLGKFVNLLLHLPKQRAGKSVDTNHTKAHILRVMQQYKFEETPYTTDFRIAFAFFAELFDVSLRDIERGISLYALALPSREDEHGLLAYVIALKVTQPNIFKGLLLGNKNEHELALRALQSRQAELRDIAKRGSHLLERVTAIHLTEIATEEQMGDKHAVKAEFNSAEHLHRCFLRIVQEIDLPIDRTS